MVVGVGGESKDMAERGKCCRVRNSPQNRACSRQLGSWLSRARADGMGRWERAGIMIREMSVGGVRDG